MVYHKHFIGMTLGRLNFVWVTYVDHFKWTSIKSLQCCISSQVCLYTLQNIVKLFFFVLDSHGKKAKVSSSLQRCCTKLHTWIRIHLIIKSSLITMLCFELFVASAVIKALGTWALWLQSGKVPKHILSFQLVSSPIEINGIVPVLSQT